MSASVTVALKAGYLARAVCLVASPVGDVWRIMARDANGGEHDGVAVDGITPPPLATIEEARAYLVALMNRSGVDITRLWAEPIEREARAYLAPCARGAGYEVRPT